MICRNCGKVLKEYDKFCSNCGTIVEREGTEEFVFTAPERDFEWNVHAFPTGEHQKTKDAVFDWGREVKVTVLSLRIKRQKKNRMLSR